jgi:DNA-binding transcriptional ArsR family regulator
MREIHFTVPDLALTKVRSTVGPAAESLFAMQLFERGGGGALFARWRQVVRRRLGSEIYVLLRAARSARPGAEIFDKRCRSATGRLPNGRESRRSELMAAVWQFHHVAVAPYWHRIHRYLEIDREFRGRTFISGGVDHMLTTLHPQITWAPPVLTASDESDEVTYLDGRGLVLVPSLFLFDRPSLFLDSSNADAPLVLVYPIWLDTPSAAALWSTGDRSEKALGALVGRTRAEVLRALNESCTTSELGRRLGISPAAASQHTAILREAGLITSRRKFNMVIHGLTRLGAALIWGEDLPGQQPEESPEAGVGHVGDGFADLRAS